MKPSLLRFVIFAGLLPLSSSAQSIMEDFSTSNIDSARSAGIWNLVNRRLHVPHVVDRTVDAVHNEDDAVPIGTGKDGVFDAATMAQFDVNKGADPTKVLLDSGTIYEFTTFTLPSTTTLTCQGANALRIRVQGDVNIDGKIDLNGKAGSTTGGTGACGGGSGGAGGINGAGVDGVSGHHTIDGGGGGATIGTTGGGGAGHFAAGATGGPAGSGGVGGALYGSDSVAEFFGGSGGGGGASNSVSQAGGGGGGAGALFLTSGQTVSLGSSGKILASGGAGGAGTGGGGGGGSGGTILIFAGGLYSHNATAEVFAQPGAGAGDGGNGRDGRTRIENTDLLTINGSGNFLPTPQAAEGRVRFSQIPVVVVSQSYNTGLVSPHYDSIDVTENTVGGTITYEVSASHDNFASDDTGFVARENISQLNGRPYFKYRVTLRSTTPTATPYVSALTMNVSEGLKSEFLFQSAACNAVHHERLSLQAIFGSVLFLTYLALFPWLLRKLRLLRPTETAGVEAPRLHRRVADGLPRSRTAHKDASSPGARA